MTKNKTTKLPAYLAVLLLLITLLAACQTPNQPPQSTNQPINQSTNQPPQSTQSTTQPTATQPTPTNLPAPATPTITQSPITQSPITQSPITQSPITPSPTTQSTQSTNQPTPTPIRFAVIGDYGLAGDPAAAVATLVKGWQPEFIITTGDNNYPIGSAETIDQNIGQYYAEYIYPYTGMYEAGTAEKNRFYPSLGNHDWDAPGIDPYLAYFTLPGNERYYDFSAGPVHLFALNTDSREPDGVSAGSIQAAWLQSELAASDLPWKIVYGHLSPYASGPNQGIAWINWPFQEWGATALLAGHDHIYERIMRNGFPYIINGLGGGPRYAIEEIVSGSEVRYRDNHGAMLVTADWQQITFQFFTIQNELIDTYTIENDLGDSHLIK